MPYPPIIIVGESGSGKSTLADELIKNCPQLKRAVTYTTRPMREYERDGVDYHFVSTEEFNKLVSEKFFLEYAYYRGWKYGTAKCDCCDNSVLVLTPSGMREVKKATNNKAVSIYLRVDRASRLKKLIDRGDDIDEAYRRNLTDVGQFDGLEKEANYLFDNSQYRYTPYYIAEFVMDMIEYEKVPVKKVKE